MKKEDYEDGIQFVNYRQMEIERLGEAGAPNNRIQELPEGVIVILIYSIAHRVEDVLMRELGYSLDEKLTKELNDFWTSGKNKRTGVVRQIFINRIPASAKEVYVYSIPYEKLDRIYKEENAKRKAEAENKTKS